MKDKKPSYKKVGSRQGDVDAVAGGRTVRGEGRRDVNLSVNGRSESKDKNVQKNKKTAKRVLLGGN